jgi:cell division septum initiation protein DivIVA
MSENTSTTELTSQYTAQVTADLERNTKEQERIGAEIAALQEQLAALQRDHQVLVSIQQAIDAAPPSVEPAVVAAAVADSVSVPAPRKKAAAKSGTSTRTRAKKTAPGPRRGTAGKTAKAKAAETTPPKLVDLVRNHLAEQSEPRSAAEIATALGQAHPDRNIKATVVRTTLEGLVARTQAQRTKQGSSVFYTSPDTTQQGTASKTKEEPAPSDA